MEQPTAGRVHQRKRLVVDKKWQLSVTAGIGGFALAAGVLCLLGTYVLSIADPVDRLSGQEMAMLALAVTGGYFAIVITFLVVAAIRITHRVAGPALVIGRALAALREGRYDSRLTLRKGDYLQEVAAEAKRLTEQLQRQRDDHERIRSEIAAAVERGDRAVALKLLVHLGAANDALATPGSPSAKAA